VHWSHPQASGWQIGTAAMVSCAAARNRRMSVSVTTGTGGMVADIWRLPERETAVCQISN
jgi:hypothetical protein